MLNSSILNCTDWISHTGKVRFILTSRTAYFVVRNEVLSSVPWLDLYHSGTLIVSHGIMACRKVCMPLADDLCPRCCARCLYWSSVVICLRNYPHKSSDGRFIMNAWKPLNKLIGRRCRRWNLMSHLWKKMVPLIRFRLNTNTTFLGTSVIHAYLIVAHGSSPLSYGESHLMR